MINNQTNRPTGRTPQSVSAVTDNAFAAAAAPRSLIFTQEVWDRVAVLNEAAAKKDKEQQNKLRAMTRELANELRVVVAADYEGFTSAIGFRKTAIFDALIKNGQANGFGAAVFYVAHALSKDKSRLSASLLKKIEDFMELYLRPS